MQRPLLSPDALVLFQTGGDANWGFLSLFAAAALQKCSWVCCCLLVSTWLFVVWGFLKFVGVFFSPCEDRNRKGLLDDASFQGHSFVLSCCENELELISLQDPPCHLRCSRSVYMGGEGEFIPLLFGCPFQQGYPG